MASETVIYCGGRGSGKTLSMSVWGFYAQIAGKNVWANYPINFKFGLSERSVKTYRSLPIEIDDLVVMRDDISDGFILLDELNLWANNRGSMAMVNRLLNAWMQLLRKRRLSLYISVQAFESLDKMVRFQCDASIHCMDLKYKYRNLPEGAIISHVITDRSGMYTGRPLYSWDDWKAYWRNSKQRMMSGRKFWGIYDSWNEYDILKAMTRYEIQRDVKLIGSDGTIEPVFSEQQNITVDHAKLMKLRSDLLTSNPEGVRCDRFELFNMMQAAGINGSPRYCNRLLNDGGFLEDGETFILPVE